jgi:hypothetical protein
MAKTKSLTLTNENIQEIEQICSTTVPAEVLQSTKGQLSQTLQNGNPLNRLLKDPETGKIIGFLAVEDNIDAEGKKIAYL